MSTTFPGHQVIVIGGGLAGFSAANTVLENGGRVIILDKSSFCGGNSSKATSGINGSETRTQKAQSIQDSNELFYNDTVKGGAKKPELAKVLTYESGPSVDWLMEKFDLDLSLLAQLGGHSAKRTHRGKERFPGLTITYALMQMCERVQEKNPDLCRIVNKSRVNKLLTNEKGEVIGCEYEKGGQISREFGPVIICTGGFAADFSKDSLLAKYRPDLLHLATTNGEHCTGDGIKMASDIGGELIDMEFVQVHPTGLVNPEDPDAKVKFLAAEALRGEGGILIDGEGNRFCNELGRRDYVTVEIWKNGKGPFRLVLNSVASTAIHWHCEHYKGRGVMKKFDSGADLAKELGVPASKLAETFQKYTETAQKVLANPDQGPYDAYPSGKTFDIHGKKYFNNPVYKMDDVFHVAQIVPLLHYTMGGVLVDTFGRVVNKSGKAIDGLYAAGEVAGGVHGQNRLGGNSLLDCVVFGRVSGKHVVEYLYGQCKSVNLKEIAAAIPVPVAATVTAPVALVVGGEIPAGHFTLEDVAKHNKKTDCWVAINGQVLNVTSFLKNHPGGELAILTFAGKDASKEFNMLHDAGVVQKYAPECIVGKLWTGAPVGAAAAAAVPAIAVASGPTFTLEQIAQHNKKNDCWVAVNGQVLNVTSFLKDHPGGELAILTFAGKDATPEFNMLHPAGVVQKYASECIIGTVSAGVSSALPAQTHAAPQDLSAPLLTQNYDTVAATHWWGEARNTASDYGAFGPSFTAMFSTVYHMALLFITETLKTVFFTKNLLSPFTSLHDKQALTRSAIFLIIFIFIHGLGNIHVFFGPDAFNGYAYFLNRPVPWDTLLLPVEIYLLFAALIHVVVATVRTYKFKKFSMLTDSNMRGQLNLAISGFLLLIFLIVHLKQFRIISNYPLYTFRVKWMYPFFCARDNQSCDVATFKDLYKMEFQLFENPLWVAFYLVSVTVFVTHMKEGFSKLVMAADAIPKKEKGMAKLIAVCASWFIAALYFSYPVFCYLFPVRDWKSYDAEHVSSWVNKNQAVEEQHVLGKK